MTTNNAYQTIPANFPGNYVIFENPVSVYTYAPNLDIYQANDPCLMDISLYCDPKMFLEVFNEINNEALQFGSRVIAFNYSADIVKALRECLEKYHSDILDMWRLVSFFHDNVSTTRISCSNGKNPLDQKSELLIEMSCFPYIKKLEIPYKKTITLDYLSAIFT